MVKITVEIRAVAFSSSLVVIADPGTRRAGTEDSFLVRTLKGLHPELS